MSDALEQIGVLVACHDRRERSLSVLSQLLVQSEGVFNVQIFAYDAGSSDGTAEALRGLGDRVRPTPGTDKNYWASSMRIAADEAECWAPDWYMLLNDDIRLSHGIMRSFEWETRTLKATARRSSVYVGEIRDPAKGVLVYGARTQSVTDPFNFTLDQDRASPVDTCNGNFVLVGCDAYLRAGGFPAGFTHGYADFILGLRLRRAGIELTRLPNIAGEGERDTPHGQEKNGERSLIERIRIARSPFGMPVREQWKYCVEVAGLARAPLNLLRSYRRVVFPDGGSPLE